MRFVNGIDFGKMGDAIEFILEGKCKRVDVSPDVKVYECKNIIRIDIKIHTDE